MADVYGTVFMSYNAEAIIGSDWPQDVVKSYLEDSLDHINISHNIDISSDYSFDPYNDCAHNNYNSSVHDSGLHCAYDKFANWVSGHSDEAADVNICLLRDASYDGPGGLGACTNSVAVAKGAEHIDDVSSSLPRFDTGYSYAWAKVAMHEAGHCLSASHGDGIVRDYDQVYDACYMTPMLPDYDEQTQNNCGEATVDRDSYSNDYNDQYFWDNCTGDVIDNYTQSGC